MIQFLFFEVFFFSFASYAPDSTPTTLLGDLDLFEASNDFTADFAHFESTRMNKTMKFFALKMMSTLGSIRHLIDATCPLVNGKRASDINRLDEGFDKLSKEFDELRQAHHHLKFANSLRNQMHHISAMSKKDL